jgi:hypothetical protein
MDKETWLTAEETVENGLANAIAPEKAAQNLTKFDLSAFEAAPKPEAEVLTLKIEADTSAIEPLAAGGSCHRHGRRVRRNPDAAPRAPTERPPASTCCLSASRAKQSPKRPLGKASRSVAMTPHSHRWSPLT